MCEQTRAALSAVKSLPRNGGLSKVSVMLIENIIKDNEKMGERMTEIEKRVGSLEHKVDVGFAGLSAQMEEIKKIIQNKEPTFYEKLLSFKDYKYFWITLIIIVLLIGALLGVAPSLFHGILTIS